MASELSPLSAFSAMDSTSTDPAEFFLFSTDPDAPVDPSSTPAQYSETAERLNSQFRFYRNRNQRTKADDTLLQVLQVCTEHRSEMVLDALERVKNEFFTYSPAFGTAVENCAWDTFLYMRERLPDSLILLNVVVLFSGFLHQSGNYQREVSKERLTAVADFLIPRCDKFVAEAVSALMATLNGHMRAYIDISGMLGKVAVLLKKQFATSAERCWAFILIASCHSAYLPSQRRESEKLLRLALLEAMQERAASSLYWCGQTLRDRVVERNYESAEVIEVWFTKVTSLRAHKFLRERYALWLRQLYRNS